MQANKTGAYTLAFISILFWSTMGSAFKLTLAYISPAMLLLIAAFTAFIFLGIQVTVTRIPFNIKQLSKKHWINSAAMGLFNPLLYYLVLFEAYRRIPAQEGVALNYIWPLMLVIFSVIFLKQHISLLSIVAILVSFAGTVIIAAHGNLADLHFSDPAGVAMALGSALFWASFWILNMKDSRDAIPKMFLNFAFGFLYILIYCLVTGKLVLPPWQGLAGGIYIGIFEMGLTFVLWLKALDRTPNTARISNLVFISPFISLMLVSVIVGEKILLSTVAGLTIIVSGILLQQYSHWTETRTKA